MVAGALIVLGPVTVPHALAAPGDLDTTFANAGRFLAPHDPLVGLEGYATVIQKDGKIVVAGKRFADGDSDVALWRLNPIGTLDTTFGSAGQVVLSLPDFQIALTVALQEDRDGKILAVGSTLGPGPDAAEDFALARFNSDGSPDVTFGTGGLVSTDFGFGADEAFAVALQKDGRIVAAGDATDPDSKSVFGLARYLRDGRLDVSFDREGLVTTDFGGPADVGGLAIQHDGKIVAAGEVLSGSGKGDFALARYQKNGSLDRSFGRAGKVVTDFGVDEADSASGIAIQKDGKIVTVGKTRRNGNNHFALARYWKNGNLDQSFSGFGRVITPVGTFDEAQGVAIQRDGKIVAAGLAGPGNAVAVVRYLGR